MLSCKATHKGNKQPFCSEHRVVINLKFSRASRGRGRNRSLQTAHPFLTQLNLSCKALQMMIKGKSAYMQHCKSWSVYHKKAQASPILWGFIERTEEELLLNSQVNKSLKAHNTGSLAVLLIQHPAGQHNRARVKPLHHFPALFFLSFLRLAAVWKAASSQVSSASSSSSARAPGME